MRERKLVPHAGLVVAAGMAFAWTALAAEPLSARLSVCSAKADPTTRLACFDQVAASVAKAETPAEPARSAAAVPPPAPAPDPFAKRTTAPEKKTSAGSNGEATPKPLMTARVVSLARATAGGELRLTLDNDQVWQENEHDDDLDLATGQTVRIKPGALGSFVLLAESGRSVRVHRIR